MPRAYLSGGMLVSTKTPFNIAPGYSSSWFPSMPPMSSGGWSAYGGLYERQLWVYVLVNKLAGAEARLPLLVYRRGSDESRERDNEHPMAKLLSKPNPGMSGFTLREWTSSMENLFGEAFWYKRRRNGEVSGLFPLHPVAMVENKDGSWTFDNGSTKIEGISRADLVHFKRFNPRSDARGMSPLEPLRATLENEWHARTATSSFWQRGARPGMFLSHPQNLSLPAQERLQAQIDGMHSGSARTGSTFLLEEGMTPHPMTLTAEEAQYIETRKLNREEVCAAYDVPPPVVHILDRATFSNITEQMRSMYRDTMGPPLGRHEAVIEVDLRATEWPNDDVYAEHLLDQVLRGDFEARQEALNKADHMTIAEKRRVENLPFIDGTDRIFLNTATLPLDAIDAQAELDRAQAASEPVPDNVVPLPTARSVVGRLSWQRSLEDVDPLHLVKGLSDSESLVVFRSLAEERAAGGSVDGLRKRLQRKSLEDELTRDQQRIAAVLRGYFGERNLDDDVLTERLHVAALELSEIVGSSTAKSLGFEGGYSVDRTEAFLLAVAERYAVTINATTREQVAKDAEQGWANADSRTPGLAVALGATVAGFASVEAGKQVSEQGASPTKTWVTGSNPRPAHAAMNGETVPIGDRFSNGMDWPGDGDQDDIGCNCTITIQAGD